MNEISTSDLCTSDTDDPDQLCALFDNILRSLLGRHAHVKRRRITARFLSRSHSVYAVCE